VIALLKLKAIEIKARVLIPQIRIFWATIASPRVFGRPAGKWINRVTSMLSRESNSMTSENQTKVVTVIDTDPLYLQDGILQAKDVLGDSR
jgi:hypothetical protein